MGKEIIQDNKFSYLERLLERKKKVATHAENKRGNLFLGIALSIGIFLLSYPSVSNYWNSFQQRRAIMGYAQQVAKMNSGEYESQLSLARAYNAKLLPGMIRRTLNEEEFKEYQEQLNFNASGNMGYLDIPKIRVKLPVYHGTSDQVLLTSIGHIPESSLPVGGESSHCVLSGHRGLPSAKLLSDLDKVTDGDTFTLSILNETYTYEVDRIRVVVPTDMSGLKIEKGKDLCTLVTCTPYGVNSHRLLVRGHRVENLNGDAQVVADALLMEPSYVAPFIMLPLIAGLLIFLAFTTRGSQA